MKLAARLQQANIVPVLSTGSSGSLPWYTMPFVTGESLRARIAAGRMVTVIPARSSRWPAIAGRNRQQYDVSPDGQRFLMIRERGMTTAPTAVYVENWLTELTAKVKRQEM